MFKGRRRFRGDEKWDIFQIIPRVKILKQVQDDGMPDQVRHDDVQDDEIPGQARDEEMPDRVRHDEIAGQARNDEGDLVRRFSIDLEERLKCNMGRAKEDACMLEKIINNKP